MIEPITTADRTAEAPPPHREPLFSLGWAILSLAVLVACKHSNTCINQYLARHQSGDFGTLNAEDRQVNRRAIVAGLSIRSEYTLPNGTAILIITDADRAFTRVMLPSEY